MLGSGACGGSFPGGIRQPVFQGCGVGDQTRCAVVSVMSNPACRVHRTSRNGFSRFLFFAKSSCAQLQSQLDVVLDAEHLLINRILRVAYSGRKTGSSAGSCFPVLQQRITADKTISPQHLDPCRCSPGLIYIKEEPGHVKSVRALLRNGAG